MPGKVEGWAGRGTGTSYAKAQASGRRLLCWRNWSEGRWQRCSGEVSRGETGHAGSAIALALNVPPSMVTEVMRVDGSDTVSSRLVIEACSFWFLIQKESYSRYGRCFKYINIIMFSWISNVQGRPLPQGVLRRLGVLTTSFIFIF